MAIGSVRVSAPAKLNLSLSVLARRDDGFHDIDSVMARLTLADELTLCERRGEEDRLERQASDGDPWLDAAPLPVDGSNLVLRATDAYRAAARERGVPVPPLAWRLLKRVPVAAGLGGGSSDAAAALELLARRYPAGVELPALAARLGSDVPFFLLRSVAARARGRGEVLEAARVPALPLVLVNPGVPVQAADAYRWWRPAGSAAGAAGREAKARGAGPTERAELLPVRAAWWSGPRVHNELQAGVAAHVPEVAATLAALREAWDGPLAMSGSGATCFALVPDRAAAEGLARRLEERLPEAWIRVSALAAETLD